MTAKAKLSPADTSPLERLSHLVEGDMMGVNNLILARMQSDVALIPQLAGYLIAAGGKRIRPLMTLAATRLFDADTKRPYPLAAAVEFIHTATLLHDDVVDESDQRRGQASANNVFGNQASVLVGDFLFSRAFELMVEDGSIDVLRLLSSAAARITEGEVLQLSIQSNIDTTLDQYLAVIAAKTAVLFSAACEIGPVVTGQDARTRQALHDYGHHLGLAFQIADDVLDYQSDDETLGKTIGDDFREGKMTAPVIFALQGAHSEDRAFWHRVFVDKDIEESDLSRAKDLIRARGADRMAMELAEHHAVVSSRALDIFPHSALRETMQDLAFHAVRRKR